MRGMAFLTILTSGQALPPKSGVDGVRWGIFLPPMPPMKMINGGAFSHTHNIRAGSPTPQPVGMMDSYSSGMVSKINFLQWLFLFRIILITTYLWICASQNTFLSHTGSQTLAQVHPWQKLHSGHNNSPHCWPHLPNQKQVTNPSESIVLGKSLNVLTLLSCFSVSASS